MTTKLQKFMSVQTMCRIVDEKRTEHIVEVFAGVEGAEDKYKGAWFKKWLDSTATMCNGFDTGPFYPNQKSALGKVPVYQFIDNSSKLKFIRTVKAACNNEVDFIVN